MFQDIRLNKDYRTAYIKDFRRFLESKTDNPKYEAFLSAKTLCKTRIDDAFKTATNVVTRLYKPEDVSTLQKLQKKYNTVDATAKDSCFYFAVIEKKGKPVNVLNEYRDEEQKSKHFSGKSHRVLAVLVRKRLSCWLEGPTTSSDRPKAPVKH